MIGLPLPALTLRAPTVHVVLNGQLTTAPDALRMAVTSGDALRPLAALSELARQLDAAEQPAVREILAWRQPAAATLPMHLHASFRRLSRETNAQCGAYVRAAQELAAALRACGTSALVVDDVTCLDVPTLLVLTQLIIACETTPVQFWLVASRGSGQPSGRAYERARALYAQRCLTRIAPLLHVPYSGRELAAAFEVRAAEQSCPPAFGAEDALRLLHHDTALLAFDAAYLHADTALQAAEFTMHAAQVQETQVLLDLNVFGPADATVRARQAFEHSSGIAQARMAYALGVLQAKRTLDDQAAEETFTRGLTGLMEAATPSARLERAWLTNGLGLVAALQAARVNALDRDLRAAMAYEEHALAEVAQDEHAEAAYLRANITTNQVTALEMAGHLSDAAALWQSQAADPASLTDRACAFHYRLGVLLWKGEDMTGAAAALTSALNESPCTGTAGRVRFALAVTALAAAQPMRARTHLLRLLWDARALHLWGDVLEALQALRAWNLEMIPADTLQQAARLAALTASDRRNPTSSAPGALTPRSKLPAGAPLIDLAAPVDADFTRSLIACTLAPQTVP